MTHDPQKLGSPCPLCGRPLVRRERSIFWHDAYRDAAFCDGYKQDALHMATVWPIVNDQIGGVNQRGNENDVR
jgi:hypothetical protein